MKLKKQVTVCGAAVFCVAVFSLYLMLDHVQRDPARPLPGGHLPRSQISALQSRIEQLEQLLEENHEIIGRIKDSVLELTVGHEGRSALLPLRLANGSWALPADGRPGFFSVAPGDCRLGPRAARPEPVLQMLAVSALLPYDNQDGGAWKQGFEITYEPHEWDAQPLQVFVVPHSHNDPGHTLLLKRGSLSGLEAIGVSGLKPATYSNIVTMGNWEGGSYGAWQMCSQNNIPSKKVICTHPCTWTDVDGRNLYLWQ